MHYKVKLRTYGQKISQNKNMIRLNFQIKSGMKIKYFYQRKLLLIRLLLRKLVL